MPELYLLLDLVVVVALVILGATVLAKNTSIELNRIFAYFVLCISVWIIANYISNDTSKSPGTAVIANYFVFSFSYAAAVFLVRFGAVLAGDARAQRIL